MSSLLSFDLNIDKEYLPLINDIIRMSVIQIVAQFLFVLSNPSQNSMFGETFIQTLFFLLIGIAVYWLIIRKVVVIN
jgi:hypothetical protein